MATDEQKKLNLIRLGSITLMSLALSVWEMLGDTSFVFSKDMGAKILNMLEKEMGLEIAGETPEIVLLELTRIFVDEFGYASDIDLDVSETKIVLKVKNDMNFAYNQQLLATGVEKLFTEPLMNACEAALKRMGYKMHQSIELWPEQKGSIITFTK